IRNMKKNKIKIAHIQLLPLLSGVQRVSLDELIRLDDHLYDKYLICKEPGDLTKACEDYNINVLFVDDFVREISLIKDIKSFFLLFKIFKQYKFDIIHSHSSKTGVLARLAAKLARIPLIVHTVHGFAFPAAKSSFERRLYYILEKIGSEVSDKIICLHKFDYNIAVDELKVNKNIPVIIPNGVDVTKFNPNRKFIKKTIRDECNISENDIVVGFIGRLWKQKNPKVLLDAAFLILKSRQDVHFIFSGDGEYIDEFRRLVVMKKLASNIHFIGWRNDIPDILKSFDIFVLPSLWEGMPLAILEAQATGLPCIVSSIQGNNILVTDNVNGFLFDLSDSTDLIDKLNILINNSKLREQFGINALSSIKNNYLIDERIIKINELYQSGLD
ncbi:glycosyltransferase family 4 protein, partial [Photobacterium damselae]|uniref:glycosyltransferase family 4 protein n=1 Tax=Photobacterium damselae TaxID=38293 RepID=UPI001EFE0F2A